MSRARRLVAAVLLPVAAAGAVAGSVVEPIRANDNRVRAGRCEGRVCRVALEVRAGRWYPEEEGGPHLDVAAIGEREGALSIPGPLLRAAAGDTFDVTITNALADSAITVHGLVERPARDGAPITVAPGGTARARFAAGQAGTYLYWVKLGVHTDSAAVQWDHLAGALIVDSAGPVPPDRVLVINALVDTVREADTLRWRQVLAINGKSFPHTESFTIPVGDTVHWRWVNGSRRLHPMHLHGFYFRVDAHGSALADTVYPAAQRWLAVTEGVLARETLDVTWAPDREGNWLFHCHLSYHAAAGLRQPRPGLPPRHAAHATNDPGEHMSGLVVGIHVPPSPRDAERVRRRERLYVQGRPGAAAMSFVLARGRPPAPDSTRVPGTPLVLTRGELTEVTVINRLPVPTGVHWHGLELESWSDGVVGWSGMGTRVAPMIAPGDSFVARLTLARAGTFMYHSHLDDVAQLSAGLYGPLIVLEPGRRFDPSRDHILMLGWIDGAGAERMALNGDTLPPPLVLRAGVPHRLRFLNIATGSIPRWTLWRGDSLQTWRRLAKDGADLPPASAIVTPARLRPLMGETMDTEWTPAPGRYELRLGPAERPAIVQVIEAR